MIKFHIGTNWILVDHHSISATNVKCETCLVFYYCMAKENRQPMIN